MSEAEKSAEIEDVLSSIRRLVADGPRVEENKSKPLSLATARVEPPLSAPKDIEETTEELPVAEEEPLEPIIVGTDEAIFEAQARVEDEDDPITFVQAINASIAEMTKGHSIEADIEAEAPAHETVSDNTSEIEDVSDLPNDPDQETRAAHVNAFLANETTKPSEVDAPNPEKLEPFVLRAEMETEAEGTSDDIVAEEPEEEPTAFYEEYIAEEDMPEPEAEATFQAIPEQTETLDVADDFDDETPTEIEETSNDAFIDEETLREIVSELVRAELQGDLGDRITRNVRKLVRREIHHALASREIP